MCVGCQQSGFINSFSLYTVLHKLISKCFKKSVSVYSKYSFHKRRPNSNKYFNAFNFYDEQFYENVAGFTFLIRLFSEYSMVIISVSIYYLRQSVAYQFCNISMPIYSLSCSEINPYA